MHTRTSRRHLTIVTNRPAAYLMLLFCLLCHLGCSFAETTAVADESFSLTVDNPVITQATQSQPALITIKGQTDLPNRTILNVTLYYQPYVSESAQDKEGTLINLKQGGVTDGVYQVDFGPFTGTLPSGTYFATVNFDPAKQYKVVKEKIGNRTNPINREIKLSFGTADELIREKSHMMESTRQQSLKLVDLYTALKNNIKQEISRPATEKKGHPAWVNQLIKDIDAAMTECERLDPLDMFQHISQRKAFVESSGHQLKELTALADKILMSSERNSSQNYEILLKALDDANNSIEKGLTDLGINKPVETDRIAEQIKQIEKQLDNLQDKIKTPPDEIKSENYLNWLTGEKQELTDLCLALAAALESADYPTINILSHNLVELWPIMESTGEETEKNRHFAEYRTEITKLLNRIKSDYLKK